LPVCLRWQRSSPGCFNDKSAGFFLSLLTIFYQKSNGGTCHNSLPEGYRDSGTDTFTGNVREFHPRIKVIAKEWSMQEECSRPLSSNPVLTPFQSPFHNSAGVLKMSAALCGRLVAGIVFVSVLLC
jgi:hypothetical protein